MAITWTSNAKYLGVTFTKNMNWTTHVNVITAKANNCQIFLQRNFSKISTETKLSCYRTYVRPILEYASPVWDPVDNNTLMNKLEMVQHMAARWICNQWDRTHSPSQMLSALSLQPLESRRRAKKVKIPNEIAYHKKLVNANAIPGRQRCKDLRYQPTFASIKSFFYLIHVIEK